MSLDWIAAELAAWEAAGLRRRLTPGLGAMGPVVHPDGRELVNFASNDYLGLASDPRLAEAAIGACRATGVGRGSSPLICGRSEVHVELERRLAAFEGVEAALLFPSGFAANSGTIPALVGPGDAVFSDARNHASIIDGCRLSGAAIHVFPHNDPAALDTLLHEQAGCHRRLLIATDTLFSMDGDLAPMAEIAVLAARHGAMLLVDEAHATGVLGRLGRGGVELAAERRPELAELLERTVHVRVGTLSKALGTAGGFVAGTRELVEWLANRARSYVFSTAQPAAAAAAGIAALEIVEREPERRTGLLAAAAELRRALADQGWRVGAGECQIVPVIVGEPQAAVAVAEKLRERGLWVPAIRPPSVPAGESLLRISLTASHTSAMRARLIESLAAVRLGG
ncbi:MAG: 8-amino-7-oxononanoate synthase [Pirellulales bacterium]|nr:8-amino-7-oxononanoate synthase [Pirellulales bacterium]